MAYTCNPSTLGDQGERIARAQEFETSLGKRQQDPVSMNKLKIS